MFKGNCSSNLVLEIGKIQVEIFSWQKHNCIIDFFCVVCCTDIKKMPLGKLSKIQIAKGFDVLEEIEAAMNKKGGNKKKNLEELSSKFFTTIPHNFGRSRPPTIDDKEIVEKKKEMLMVRFVWIICWDEQIVVDVFSVVG